MLIDVYVRWVRKQRNIYVYTNNIEKCYYINAKTQRNVRGFAVWTKAILTIPYIHIYCNSAAANIYVHISEYKSRTSIVNNNKVRSPV